jgi:glutathione S-transferase
MPDYVLHIANKTYSSGCLGPWLTMRQLEIPFEEHLIPLGACGAVGSPVSHIPALRNRGAFVWGCLAVLEYLAEDHPGVWPDRRTARTWSRSAAAETHGGFRALQDDLPLICGVRIDASPRPAALGDLGRIERLWLEGLWNFGGPWLAGEAFSAVDACFAPVALLMQTYGVKLEPTAMAYSGRLLGLKPVQDWYASALAEPWRDPVLEAKGRASGRWISDLRTEGERAHRAS